MAETTLREYLRQLEDILERDALDEVIAHCRYILERFPKNLATYRLLGKALLEKQRHQDASDIFQRVLSSEPSDFVSHLGMSIIYQEEGAVDQAIWHMERAFEQSPNNAALQDELRDLFRQRDGAEPVKLQLTRGALARLYAKGDLHGQAISELTQAIEENPDRLDLQTLLAETLWNDRKPVEAGQIAAQVLHRLPNCLQANRILAELWLEAGQSSEAQPFLQRVEALDPYMALELKSGGKIVPDDAIRLERLEWTTEAAAAALDAPDWVRDLSVAFDQTSGRPVRPTLPETPTTPAEEPEQAEPGIPPPPAAPGPAEPDWLGQIIGEADQAEPEQPRQVAKEPPELEEMPPSPTEPIVAEQQPSPVAPPAGSDEAPEWLSEIVTDQPSPLPPAEQPSKPSLEEAPDWLSDIIGDESLPLEPEPSPAPETVEDDRLASLPTDEPVPKQPVSEVAPADEVPDWLREVQEPAQPGAPGAGPPEVEQAGAEPAEAIPDWLRSAIEEAPEPKQAEQPSPLAEPEAAEQPVSMPKEEVEVAPPIDEQTGEEMPEEEMPEWMTSGDLDSDDALAWLESLAARQGADPEEFVSEQMRAEGEEPAAEVEPQPSPAAEEEPEPVSLGEEAEEDALAWLESLAGETEAVPEEVIAEKLGEEVAGEADTGEDIDWLREPTEAEPVEVPPVSEEVAAPLLAEEEPEAPAIPEPEPEPAEALPVAEEIEIPAVAEEVAAPLLAEEEPEAPAIPEPEPEPVEAPPVAEEIEIPAVAEEVAAPLLAEEEPEAPAIPEPEPTAAEPVEAIAAEEMAWLDELAAEQGAEPDEFIVEELKPAEPAPALEQPAPEAPAELPDWLAAVAEAAPEAEAEPELPEAEVEEEEIAWLAEELEGREPAEEAEELAELLRAEAPPLEEAEPEEIKIEPPELIIPTPVAEAPIAPLVEEELPDWLKGLGEPEEEAPEWLTPEAEAEAPPVSAEPPVVEAEELPDWLKPEVPEVEEIAPPPAAPAAEPEAAVDRGLIELPGVPADLAEVSEELVSEPPAPEAVEEKPEPAPELEPALPDWLKEAQAAADESIEAFLEEVQPPIPEVVEEVAAPPVAEEKPEVPAVPEPEPVVEAPPAPVVTEPLALARQQMSLGNTEQALDAYEDLISEKQTLDEVIGDLQEVVSGEEAIVPRTYRLLGDALMAQDKMQEALDAYRNALDQM